MREWRYRSTPFDLGTRRFWVVRFMPLPLYPRYPLDSRLGGPQSRSGRCGEKKNHWLPGSHPGRPASTPSLYRLSYPGWNTEIRFRFSGLWTCHLVTVTSQTAEGLWRIRRLCVGKFLKGHGTTETVKTIKHNIIYETSMKVSIWFILSWRKEKGSNIVAVFKVCFIVSSGVNVVKTYCKVHPPKE
jgi:hypothetical protein